MVRKALRRTVPLAISLIVIGTTVFGMGLWRRSGDAKWCRNATTSGEVAETAHALTQTPDLERQRSACAVQRQRQRVMFGSVWRTGGREMAECGFQLARLQLLSDPEARDAILQPYGLEDGGFDAGSREGQSRFVQACASNDRHKAG